MWEAYFGDVTSVSVDAGTPTMVPLTVSVPTGAGSLDQLAVEIAMTDCAAGPFTLDVRLLSEDGTALDPAGFRASAATPSTLRCPDRPVVFMVPVSSFACTSGGRCSVSLTAELTSETGVGPREVEAHLLTDHCSASVRRDGTVDAWGL